jgi:septal ring factor EnvC (AmiA/AmiB activator)
LFLPIALAIGCVALVIALVMTKKGDNAQHDADTGTIADISNRLTAAQSLIALREETIVTFSNSLDETRLVSVAFSNHLTEAQSALTLAAGQITNLTRQVAEGKSENQSLGQRLVGLTNQIAGLTKQIALTAASLERTNQDLVQAYKDYALLDNRFRIDVGERTVVERKFNNPAQLKAQLQRLKLYPAGVISAESIYAGLNVEVKSNGWCHVIAPN